MIIGREVAASFDTLGVSSSITLPLDNLVVVVVVAAAVELLPQQHWLRFLHQVWEGVGQPLASLTVNLCHRWMTVVSSIWEVVLNNVFLLTQSSCYLPYSTSSRKTC
jgi:hypothetical protein